MVSVGNAVAPSTKSVKVAWITSKLGNLSVAELEKLFIRLLNLSNDLDELAKILEIKNTNKLWAKLAGLDETQLKALMNKEVSGIKLFEN